MFRNFKLLPVVGLGLCCLCSSMTTTQATVIRVITKDVTGWQPKLCWYGRDTSIGYEWDCVPVSTEPGHDKVVNVESEDQMVIVEADRGPSGTGAHMINEKVGRADKTFICTGNAQQHNCTRQ